MVISARAQRSRITTIRADDGEILEITATGGFAVGSLRDAGGRGASNPRQRRPVAGLPREALGSSGTTAAVGSRTERRPCNLLFGGSFPD